MSVLRTICPLILIATVVAPATALEPHEVLVVANANVADSVTLAEYYAKARGIPKENVLLIKTGRGFHISREHYDTQIRAPIQRALLLKKLAGNIRCVCLIWGVPVRVLGPRPKPTSGPATATAPAGVGAVYRIAAKRAHYRLSIDYKLLATIGKKFPEPQTSELKPLGKLFASPLPSVPHKLTELSSLKKEIARALASKQMKAAGIKDPAKRKIAMRQIMAMYLEIYGLDGLVSYLKESRVADASNLDDLKRQLAQARQNLAGISAVEPTARNVKARLAAMEAVHGVSQVCTYAYSRIKTKSSNKQKSRWIGADAAVDSELALLFWGKYELLGPMKNVLHWRTAKAVKDMNLPITLMTARIDGPTHADAKRLIDASVAAQKKSLAGKCYIDTGGKYPAYEFHLKTLNEFMRKNTTIETVLDEKKTLFQPGQCPQAALYVGWYSLRKYVPAFDWVPGAVGWHIASFEAADLRNPKTEQWCAKMIQGGVAATLGAVYEPGLHAFPLPEEFFPLLLTGKYTVAECYWRTTPMVSWRVTLIADPLYNPFAAKPQVDPKALRKGLAP